MKVRIRSGLSVIWWPKMLMPGEVVEIPDYREAACCDLRRHVKTGHVEIVEPQKRPDYEKARAEVRA